MRGHGSERKRVPTLRPRPRLGEKVNAMPEPLILEVLTGKDARLQIAVSVEGAVLERATAIDAPAFS